ncbi:MAG: hypothetical protein J4G10_07365 [Alphaproteobacteria bacterium]|nr:hypothetical protein [Alphaproteobacteria bacterium]
MPPAGRRNPVAKKLRTKRYRPKVVADKTKYSRKKKHKDDKDGRRST